MKKVILASAVVALGGYAVSGGIGSDRVMVQDPPFEDIFVEELAQDLASFVTAAGGEPEDDEPPFEVLAVEDTAR